VVRDTRHTVIHTLDHEGLGVVVDALHAKSLEVRLERDLCVLFILGVVGHGGLALLAHVVLPRHFELEARLAVGRLDGERLGIDVGELGTVAVPAARRLLLVVVVVRGG
jgi:hypothetical protein